MASHGYRSCRTYTDEVRQSAVAMVAAGQPISAVAETLAIPRRSIVNWVKRVERAGGTVAGPPPAPPSYDVLEAEVRALRAEPKARDVANHPARRRGSTDQAL